MTFSQRVATVLFCGKELFHKLSRKHNVRAINLKKKNKSLNCEFFKINIAFFVNKKTGSNEKQCQNKLGCLNVRVCIAYKNKIKIKIKKINIE